MTIRSFWLAFFTYVTFFAVMVLCAFTFGRATTFDASGYTKEELFLLDVQTIPARNETPFFALMPQKEYGSFEELITAGQPNLVVHVSFERRGVCRVYDPFGEYTNTDLHTRHPMADISPAALYICTPYQAKIEEILLGDETVFSEGDTFTFWAPYGMVGESAVRYADTPIFSAEREYILFFSVLDVAGVGRWYDLVHPSAAVEIMIEDERTFSSMSYAGNDLFDATGYDVEDMTDLLAALYEGHPYALNIPMITPVN
ncbi:MAG: hypothetical protein IJW77_17250 [Clostridia bacterium]|nr:hypothetical protein [Clostridia bacterium]